MLLPSCCTQVTVAGFQPLRCTATQCIGQCTVRYSAPYATVLRTVPVPLPTAFDVEGVQLVAAGLQANRAAGSMSRPRSPRPVAVAEHESAGPMDQYKTLTPFRGYAGHQVDTPPPGRNREVAPALHPSNLTCAYHIAVCRGWYYWYYRYCRGYNCALYAAVPYRTVQYITECDIRYGISRSTVQYITTVVYPLHKIPRNSRDPGLGLHDPPG